MVTLAIISLLELEAADGTSWQWGYGFVVLWPGSESYVQPKTFTSGVEWRISA